MAITFDPLNKIISLDSTYTTAEIIFSEWEDWAILDDNIKYGDVMIHIGGDSLGNDMAIPNYIFLKNGWRVRPMESDHNLIIKGNLFVLEGGVPVIHTLGKYQVNVSYTVPVQAQAIIVSSGSGLSSEQDELLRSTAKQESLQIVNDGIKKASKLIPHTTSI